MSVLELTDSEFQKLWDRELEVRTQTMSHYENEGFAEIAKRSQKMCLVMSNTYQMAAKAKVIMYDSADHVLGMNLTESERG